MNHVYLVRHGEAGSAQIDDEGWWGTMRDLAPLTPRGVEQAKAAGRSLRSSEADRIVSSPLTRAMHTATLIAAETGLPVTAVELDLREWQPDSTQSWRDYTDIQALSEDLHRCEGEWPPGETRRWEPLSALRSRAVAALRRQAGSTPFIAVTHNMLIQSVTGLDDVDYCDIHRLEVSSTAGSR
ncbi:histidine phosphatase family protein [Kribbella sp. NPDC051770]|uniref:histidine phosphatase family protein n=1 Tax=Kribbella sp. NPDC051770 TaxID=3155413 RepID=UPI003445B6A9